MKYLALLLCFYTFCLVTTPCVDDVLHLNTADSGQTCHQNPGSAKDHPDACSPFCICSCCSVPVTIIPGTFLCQPYFSFHRPTLPVSSKVTSFYAVNFWQPPKVS